MTSCFQCWQRLKRLLKCPTCVTLNDWFFSRSNGWEADVRLRWPKQAVEIHMLCQLLRHYVIAITLFISPFPLGVAHFRWHYCLLSWKWDETFVIYNVYNVKCRKIHNSNPFFKAEDFVKGKMLDRCMPTMDISAHGDNEMNYNI